MSEVSDRSAPRSGRSPLVRFGLSAIAGGVVGYGVGHAIFAYKDSVPWIAAVVRSIEAGGMTGLFGGLVAAALIGLGCWMLIMGRLPDRQFKRLTNAQVDDDPRRLKRMMPIAGWGMLLYASIIVVFLIPGIPAGLGIGIGIVAFALISWLFWRGTIMMDELEQAAQREALIATFIILEALAILWALLAHYALAPPLEPLAVVLLVTVIYYGVGIIAGIRRGFAD
jgi:hypothetical protein